MSASADEVVSGLGYADYSADGGTDAALFSLEIQGNPIRSLGAIDNALGVTAEVDAESDVFVGAGLVATIVFG